MNAGCCVFSVRHQNGYNTNYLLIVLEVCSPPAELAHEVRLSCI